MGTDIVAEFGYLFLGSRLKRLAERLQTDAYKVHRAQGIDAQPAELALLGAIDRFGPMTVSAAVESLGISQPAVTRTAAALVQRGSLSSTSSESDQRQKTLKLTRQGRALVTKAKKRAWPLIEQAVTELCTTLDGPLLTQLGQLERQLSERSLETRALERSVPTDELTIREFSDELAPSFYEINATWISTMFTLEDIDREILSQPRQKIVDPGGFILFVESAELGVVGTCALMKVEPGVFELTKMGVVEAARGRKAGELLLRATLERAKTMDIETLYLLTNSKCVAAISLYEKLGFQHDARVLKKYGGEYARCDVAMSLPR
jgi:DNA-binding MarR family transcriptional regulator/N-acetylglutamate synthase-like GNAT family acetyltransferase